MSGPAKWRSPNFDLRRRSCLARATGVSRKHPSKSAILTLCRASPQTGKSIRCIFGEAHKVIDPTASRPIECPFKSQTLPTRSAPGLVTRRRLGIGAIMHQTIAECPKSRAVDGFDPGLSLVNASRYGEVSLSKNWSRGTIAIVRSTGGALSPFACQPVATG